LATAFPAAAALIGCCCIVLASDVEYLMRIVAMGAQVLVVSKQQGKQTFTV
jgi:hypothetical protein